LGIEICTFIKADLTLNLFPGESVNVFLTALAMQYHAEVWLK